MADNHGLYPVQARPRELLVIPFKFTSAGTGSVTAVTGKGISVARSGTGTFTVTMDATYPTVVAIDVNMVTSSSAINTLLACSPVTSNTFTVQNWSITTSGNAVKTELTAGFQVHGIIFAFNSSVS